MSLDILVVSPTPSHPQTAGNRARIFTLLSQIRAMGHKVHFLHINMETGDAKAMERCWSDGFYEFNYKRHRSRIRKINRIVRRRLGLNSGYTYGIDEWYDPSLDTFLKQLTEKQKFNVVIVEYVFMSRVLENFDSTTFKIIDTHDAFTNRHQQYIKQGEKPRWFSTTASQESKGLRRADAVIAIQQEEARLFSDLGSRKVVTIGHIVEVFKPEFDKVVAGRILMLGSNNRINVQGAKFFINEILPRIRQRLINAELVVVGSICNSLQQQPGMALMGEMNELRPSYASAAVVINPVLFGTGLKVKSLEALSHARPLVTTSAGALGIEEGINLAFKVADTHQGFAEEVIGLLDNQQSTIALSQGAFEFISQRNQQYVDELEKLLTLKS